MHEKIIIGAFVLGYKFLHQGQAKCHNFADPFLARNTKKAMPAFLSGNIQNTATEMKCINTCVVNLYK